jgi:hypothetical protein
MSLRPSLFGRKNGLQMYTEFPSVQVSGQKSSNYFFKNTYNPYPPSVMYLKKTFKMTLF